MNIFRDFCHGFGVILNSRYIYHRKKRYGSSHSSGESRELGVVQRFEDSRVYFLADFTGYFPDNHATK
jgi:hypothetical protein